MHFSGTSHLSKTEDISTVQVAPSDLEPAQATRIPPEYLATHDSQVPDELVLRIYKALQLPTLVQEAVSG
jgi:hypothetical protein